MLKRIFLVLSIFILTSCGGGGGGGGGGNTPTTPTTPLPTVNLSADPVSVLLESTSTLTWSSTNATSCSATWTSQTGSSGSEAVTISTAGNNSFSISCTGAGGSRSATVTVEGYRNTDGVVVDGYISGAEVCIDEDESWTCDSNESSTTSDNDGKFTIKYANGNLVSIGGTDLDSQTLLDNLLITHKLTGHSDFKAVTPVTSVAAFMIDASLVNAALGIDSSIDVSTFDPVANKGDGGVNDYLYEKGNQLTVLAYALQNITNNLNTTTETTQDYFKAITEEIEKEYTETTSKVDIETEEFITKALDNIIEAKTFTITDEAKANTTKALSGVMPVIEVKSSDDLTTSVIRFAVSTLQTDIQAIANGSAENSMLTAYSENILNYIANDQSISSDDITPSIVALADTSETEEELPVIINVLINDSYLTSAPIYISSDNGVNGETLIIDSNIQYTPDIDFNGSDTFFYTITQGDKTSSAEVSVNVLAINDEPVINTSSTIFSPENQTSISAISVSDVDGDDLILSLGENDLEFFNLSEDNFLSFKVAPDYENKNLYSLTLNLSDGEVTVTKEITIKITNVNDIAPEFTSQNIFEAPENQINIGTVTATDAEDDELEFFVSGNELEISLKGELTFKNPPDYESKSVYSATLSVSDGINTATQDITVNVTNFDGNPPVFPSQSFSAFENQNDIGTLTATDADGDNLSFSVLGTELAVTSSGILTFVDNPDYEKKSVYSATASVSDGENKVNGQITVNIINLNDIAPVFGSTEYFVDERIAEIGFIDVSDADNDPLVLSIEGGDKDAFNINSNFRTISFNEIPIYSEKSKYETTINATDGKFSISAPLIVNINQINKLQTDHPQAITGTDGDDQLNGEDRTYNILIGGKGDDVLTGGENASYVGGNIINIFQFEDNSGSDVIKDFFINTSSRKTDGRNRHDIIEVVEKINGTNIDSAKDILDNSSNNSNGDAVLNLGQGNTITIEGHPLSNIISEHIHVIPAYLKVVQGSSKTGSLIEKNNTINAFSDNSRLEGSGDPFDRFEDGADILISGTGDDVLIGGTSDSSVGGYIVDLYKFNKNNGNDLIVGFFDSDQDSSSYISYQGSGPRSDRIVLTENINNTTIDSFLDLKNETTDNDDGWAKINLGKENFITVHGVSKEQLKPDHFIFTFSDNYIEIIGDSSNNILQGSSNNEWIDGSEEFMPRFGDGIDYIFPEAGDDVLISGVKEHGAGAYADTFFYTNFFINEIGKKTIIGFSGSTSGSFNPYTNDMLDRIYIPKQTSVNYLSDLPTRYDSDEFLELLPNNETTIKLQSIKEGEITVHNIILHDSFDNYIYGTKENDELVGSSGNDFIDGWAEFGSSGGCAGLITGDDILIGGMGNDVLIGGNSSHFCGGYNRDTFRFVENSGQDIIVDFTSNFENPGYVNKFEYMDVLEIEENINGTSFKYAQDLLDISSDNQDGFAEINLGGSNTITLHGKPLSTLSSINFRILPKIDNYIIGTDGYETYFQDGKKRGEDILIGTEGNDYIKGSNRPISRFEDGHDILDGGQGDDVLDGGPNKSSVGGYIIDIYRFDKDYGFDRLFGFFARDIYQAYGGSGYKEYEAGIRSDKIEIPNDVVSSATEVIDNATNNPDGWAELKFDGTTVIMDMVRIDQLKKDYFLIVPRVTSEIVGTDDDDILIGTDGNDRILGSNKPFDRFEDGSDFIEGGKGDDLLIGGPARGSTGGSVEDIYRFNEGFGNDYLVSFYAEDILGYTNGDPTKPYSKNASSRNGDGEGAKQSTRLEFNNTFASTATELINSAEDNNDGWAKITIGENSLTIFGISKSDLKPDYFHIIPSIDNTIVGTDDDETLSGTAGNDYIQGGDHILSKFDDGSDIIIGGMGDDVLIGGLNYKSTGGYEMDDYQFDDNSGKDLIIGFLFDGTGSGGGPYNDTITLKSNINNSGISSYDDLINSTLDNADGWAVIDLGSNNSITLHGVSKSKLAERNFIIN